jgi:virginiamycin B lyase
MFVSAMAAAGLVAALEPARAGGPEPLRFFDLPAGTGAHDVAPAAEPGGPVYFTAQRAGRLGVLTPASGKVEFIDLGEGSAPHGVIIGPDRAAWVTDGGRNAILRVDPLTRAVRAWPLPSSASGANLNTAAFDGAGNLWFTGQSGFYGRLDPARDDLRVWDAPRGTGPYGIAATPAGVVYFVSLAGSYLARVDSKTGAATVIEPPTQRAGTRRVWADSHGRLWVSDWNAGKVGCYDPADGHWREWSLPGSGRAYAVWVDERDQVWLSDWTAHAIVHFDPASERFESFHAGKGIDARQLAGRHGELWGADSANGRLFVLTIPK